MNIDKDIFKSYDVRGVYPETMNEEIAKAIGIALVNKFKMKNLAVGYDGRISSPALTKAMFDGITSAGANAIDIGICTTDMTYVASAYYEDIDGAVMITASHNPSEYNGMKAVLKGAVALSGNDGLFEIRDMLLNDELETSGQKGQVITRDIYDDYAKKLLSLIDKSKVKPLKIVVDAGNGVGGFAVEKVFKYLPIEIIPLYFEIDGSFPNHQPSPIEEKNIVDLKKKVLVEKADLGLAFDGDGDRVYLVDEKGQGVSATLMSAMIAKNMLEKVPGGRILYNVNVGWIVPEIVDKMGGISSITPVGHSLIKAQMRKENGLFACEHSGHYFFRDLYYADSGIMASLFVFEILSKENKPLSQILKEFDIYALSGEINTTVKDQAAKITEIKAKYADGEQSELDGIKVEYPDWKFIVRGSNTEPLLRLNVEAKTKELMEEKRDELLAFIRQ